MVSGKICVICPRVGMGDLVSFLGHFKTIYNQTQKKLVIITKSSTSAKQILSKEKFYSEIIYLPKRKTGILNIFSDLLNFIEIVGVLKEQNCDTLFILHPSKRYVLAGKMAKFKNIYAPGKKLQRLFIKKENMYYKSFLSPKIHPRSESEELIKKIFNINKIQDNYFDNIEKNEKKNLVLLGIACSGNEKQWGVDNYKKIISFLIQKNFNNICLLSGKRQEFMEKELIEFFERKNSTKLMSTYDSDIKDIIKFFDKALFYFGNDTGFSHLSVSHRIPALIVHGDLPPHNYLPYFNPILPENNNFTKDSIKKILYEKVENHLKDFLKKYKFID